MTISISELYGKRIISNEGKLLGEVKGVILNMVDGEVSYILTDKIEDLGREDPRAELQKKGVLYKRVKKVSESVVVGAK